MTLTIGSGSLVDLAGNTGPSTAVTTTYTLNPLGPQVTLNAASINPFRSTTTLTYSVASTLTPVTTVGQSLSLVYIPSSLAAQCTQSFADPTFTISCTGGTGTITAYIPAGFTQDSAGNSSLSSNIVNISIDNTPPAITASTPTYTYPGALPNTLTLTFSKPITLPANTFPEDNFTVSGSSCGAIEYGVLNNNQITFTMSSVDPVTCTNGQTFTITPSAIITDALGNQLVNASNALTFTYTSPVVVYESAFVFTDGGPTYERTAMQRLCSSVPSGWTCTNKVPVVNFGDPNGFFETQVDCLTHATTTPCTTGFNRALPIVNMHGTLLVADNFSDFLNLSGVGPLLATTGILGQAGVINSGDTVVTGFSTGGTATTQNCNGWTDFSGAFTVGGLGSGDSTWSTQQLSCSNPTSNPPEPIFLCFCYQ